MSRTLVYWLFFFSNFFFVAKSCSETQCFRKEKDLSTKFQLLLAEEGVRIVYFKLDLTTSDSYNSLHPDRIIPTRWTWAKSNSEPLLSLSYDYDVLSVGLLKNQEKYLTLDFTSTQSQCLKALNSSCQDLEIARALLDIANASPNKALKIKTDVVCFRVLREHWFGIGSHFKYQCCKENMLDNGNGTSISCNVPVSESRWLAVFNAILAILVGVTVLYWPGIFCVLPSSFFSDENHRAPQNHVESGASCVASANTVISSSRNIRLDDYSPITLQIFLEKLRDLYPNNILDLRVKLFLVWFGFIPILFYIKLLLYVIIKSGTLDETSRKLLFQVADFYFFVFNMKRPLVYVLFVMPFFVIPCVAIFLVPTQIDCSSVIEEISKSPKKFKKNLGNIKTICRMLLKKILDSLSTSEVFGNSTCGKRSVASIYSVAYIILVVPICTVTACVIFLIISVLCLVRFSPYLVFLSYLSGSISKFSFHHRILLFYSTFSATILATFSCQFAVRMLGFVIMGILLNAEFVIPYMTFAFVVGRNIYLCFCNTQSKYKELKDIIAEKWPKGDTMPEKLFWLVSDKVLPFEMLLLFCKILAIVVFLSLALTAILLFKVTYGASAIVPTLSVFISGKFSELFFTGITTTQSNFVGSFEEKIGFVVQKYIANENDNSETTELKMPCLFVFQNFNQE